MARTAPQTTQEHDPKEKGKETVDLFSGISDQEEINEQEKAKKIIAALGEIIDDSQTQQYAATHSLTQTLLCQIDALLAEYNTNPKTEICSYESLREKISRWIQILTINQQTSNPANIALQKIQLTIIGESVAAQSKKRKPRYTSRYNNLFEKFIELLTKKSKNKIINQFATKHPHTQKALSELKQMLSFLELKKTVLTPLIEILDIIIAAKTPEEFFGALLTIPASSPYISLQGISLQAKQEMTELNTNTEKMTTLMLLCQQHIKSNPGFSELKQQLLQFKSPPQRTSRSRRENSTQFSSEIDSAKNLKALTRTVKNIQRFFGFAYVWKKVNGWVVMAKQENPRQNPFYNSLINNIFRNSAFSHAEILKKWQGDASLARNSMQNNGVFRKEQSKHEEAIKRTRNARDRTIRRNQALNTTIADLNQTIQAKDGKIEQLNQTIQQSQLLGESQTMGGTSTIGNGDKHTPKKNYIKDREKIKMYTTSLQRKVLDAFYTERAKLLKALKNSTSRPKPRASQTSTSSSPKLFSAQEAKALNPLETQKICTIIDGIVFNFLLHLSEKETKENPKKSKGAKEYLKELKQKYQKTYPDEIANLNEVFTEIAKSQRSDDGNKKDPKNNNVDYLKVLYQLYHPSKSNGYVTPSELNATTIEYIREEAKTQSPSQTTVKRSSRRPPG